MLMRKISRFLGIVWAGGLYLITRVKVMAVDPFCPGFEAGTANPKIDTALGCVPVKIEGFVTWLLPILFGFVGGISFLLMVYRLQKVIQKWSKGPGKQFRRQLRDYWYRYLLYFY